jgi:PIN domain nuclease of toxin-antitoxin system
MTDLTIRIAPLTSEVADRAALMRARHASLRLPDALVLATGDMLGADTVLTADRAWPRVSRRAQVI